jgi:serine/threonine protein kinase/tetratricopeptide (TPR) repeat protein
MTALTREAAETLAARLVGEMIQRWRQGERPLPEDFLARHPELWEHPEAAADLIYEELSLRQEYGAGHAAVEDLLRRFPQWRPQLEVLFDCQRLLGPRRAAPQFPDAGALLGDFLLLAELGRGAQGRVFLASQLSLGDRPVVLKLTPLEAGEHLSLARLQHTHIVPLHSAEDHPARGLRALCMPYFGGATVAQLLDALRPQPPARRSGQALLDAIDRVQAALPVGAFATNADQAESEGRVKEGPARHLLARASYVEAVCWVGACLAEALHYAHERGLVHLDLKPSNVLLAADGTPMLLDFHLAREPIRPEGEGPPWLGGTSGYMSPEQQAALAAAGKGRKSALPVDGRSDVYSLGVVLCEALAGSLPGESPTSLHDCNAQVSVGLADVVGKCLAPVPGDRYPDMAALAADLRRHLAHRPLLGVRNRSPAERWRKWRRRRPHGVALAGMLLAVLTAVGAVLLAAAAALTQRTEQARLALHNGQMQIEKGEWEGAIATLRRGLSAARGIPWQRDLADEMGRQLRRAQEGRTAANRAAAARELHQLTDRVRFLYGSPGTLPPAALRGLATRCGALWEKRARLVERVRPAGGVALEPAVRDGLLDLAIFWADLQVRLAPPAGKEKAHRKALAVLAQAEEAFGPSPVLDEERKLHGAPMRGAGGVGPAHTAWEHCGLARALLRSGDLQRAAEEAERAVRLRPQGLWPNFYQGLCAYRRGRYADAVTAYSVCIGAAPEAAGCFYNRALAFGALERHEQALRDYDLALRLDPTFAAAALNRGMLHYRAGHHPAALADLRRARELGADLAVVAFDLALVHLARGDDAAALDNLRRSLKHNPRQPKARKLHDSLRRRVPSCPPQSKNSAPAPRPHFR